VGNGHVPIVVKIRVGIAHPEFSTLEIFWVRTAYPGFMIIKQFSFYIILVIWVGNDALLPTQNTKSRVGKLKSMGGKVKQ